jgi:hypothetical protein
VTGCGLDIAKAIRTSRNGISRSARSMTLF